MNYIIRKKERKDCADVAHVVTVAWNETYKGIVPDDFLEGLYLNEEQRTINSYNKFDENDNHQYVLEVDGKVIGFVNVGSTDEKEIKLHKSGIPSFLIAILKHDGQLNNIEIQDNGECNGNSSYQDYKNTKDDFIQYHLSRYIK